MAAGESLIFGTPPAATELLWISSERVIEALASPIRIRILGALNDGPMSPGEFTRAHPQYSLPTATKHFHRLEKLGYIGEIGKGPGGSRIFALGVRAFFDEMSIRRMGDAGQDVDGAICTTYVERISKAFAEETFDSRPDARFHWTPLYLDERAWKAAVRATDALLIHAIRLHQEAAERLKTTDEPPITVTTGFWCLPSPSDGDIVPVVPPMHLNPKSDRPSEDDLCLDESIIKAFEHPLRTRILSALRMRPMSPKELTDLFPKYSLQAVAKHCRRLEQLGCIEIASRRVGFADQNVFCLRPSHARFDPRAYVALPDAIRRDANSVQVATFVNRLHETLLSGVLLTRPEAHLTWSGLRFDESAWHQMVEAVDSVYHFCLNLQHITARRLDAAGASAFPVTFSSACFLSPDNASTVQDATIDEIMSLNSVPHREALERYLTQVIEGARNERLGASPPVP
ncbi:MAG TPA: winged helix-turn-helix domain-containing protein [Edaphobacter sp.]|nr:winged helix-turn-helix domain-containing protein [Edaphobacter sp.]